MRLPRWLGGAPSPSVNPLPRASARLAPLMLAVTSLLVGGGGCIKQKDSLVVVALTATVDLPSAMNVTVTVAGVTRNFDLSSTGGLSMTTPVYRGVYLEHDVTGSVSVQATTQAGTPCVRYGASSNVSVPSAGATVPAPLQLAAMGSCDDAGTDGGPDVAHGLGGMTGTGGVPGTDGGAGAGGTGASDAGADSGRATGGTTGGVGGAGGTGGLGGGVGGTGGAGGLPSLANCREYIHSVGTDCTVASNETVIYSVAISPNGQLVVTAGDDGRAKVWRFDGRTLTAEGHVLSGSGFGIAAFSPDGTMIAVGWSTGIDLWSVSTWTRLRTLTTTSTVYDLAFTPDGLQIISIDSGTLYAHAIGVTAPLHSLVLPESTWAVAVSPAPSTTPAVAVATTSGTVRVYTHTTTGFVSASAPLIVNPDTSTTLSVRFSPDGRLLAAGSSDGLLHLWNYPITSTTPTVPDIDVGTPALSSDISMVAFSPNGRYIAVAGGFSPSITTWNSAAPRALIGSNLNPVDDLLSIVFSPSGTALIAGETDCGTILVCSD